MKARSTSAGNKLSSLHRNKQLKNCAHALQSFLDKIMPVNKTMGGMHKKS